jgi:hypothetical protein
MIYLKDDLEHSSGYNMLLEASPNMACALSWSWPAARPCTAAAAGWGHRYDEWWMVNKHMSSRHSLQEKAFMLVWRSTGHDETSVNN